MVFEASPSIGATSRAIVRMEVLTFWSHYLKRERSRVRNLDSNRDPTSYITCLHKERSSSVKGSRTLTKAGGKFGGLQLSGAWSIGAPLSSFWASGYSWEFWLLRGWLHVVWRSFLRVFLLEVTGVVCVGELSWSFTWSCLRLRASRGDYVFWLSVRFPLHLSACTIGFVEIQCYS